MLETRPKPFAFVLMPFSGEFDDAYKLAIKPACDAAGVHAERVDDQVFHDDILQRIYNQIAKADVVVAEMTGRNPNVFYETGYAHALGKAVILLTKHAKDIPFDLQHYPHIIYGESLSTLREQLESRVRRTLDMLSGQTPEPMSTIEVEVNGVRLGATSVVVPSEAWNGWVFKFDTQIINSVARAARPLVCQVGIVAPAGVQGAEVAQHRTLMNPIRMNDGSTAYHWPETLRILPGAWHPIALQARTTGSYRVGKELAGFAIRVFSENGYFDFPFAAQMRANA
jgi:hypothetical protein